MKPITARLFNIISITVITALLLIGAVPSFAVEETGETTESTVLPAIPIDYSDAPDLNCKSAIVMDLDTGTVVCEKNADMIVEPASVTKILTALVAIENLDLDQVVTVPEGVETSGTIIWLEPGEEITVKELLYGMLLESGNDAAEVLGLEASGGDLDKFSDMMNERARELGATNTDYANPNGLNEDGDHLNYTSARDLALMTREAMKKPIFRKVVSTKKHKIPATNKSKKRALLNSNYCLWVDTLHTEVNGESMTFKYEGCNGVKTGYTSSAGFCYVGSAEHGDTDFLVVVMNAPSSEARYQDALELWEYAFGKYETYQVMSAGDEAGVRKVWGGTKHSVSVGTAQDLGVTIEKGTAGEQDFTTEFRLDEERLDAPVAKGQKMGQALIFNSKGRLVGEQDLYALTAVGEGGPLSKIGIADEDLPEAGAIAAGVLLLIIAITTLVKRRRRKIRREKQEKIRNELSTMRTAGIGMTASELTDVTGVEEIMPIPKGPSRISDEELTAWSSTKKKKEQKQEKRSGSRFGGRMSLGGGKRGARKTSADAAGNHSTEQDVGRSKIKDYGENKGSKPARTADRDQERNAGRFAERNAARNAERDAAWNAERNAEHPAGYRERESGQTSDRNTERFARRRTNGESGGAYRMPKMNITPREPFSGRDGKYSSSQPLNKKPLTDEELSRMLESTEIYDVNQPRRHGRLTSEERQQLLRSEETQARTSQTGSDKKKRRRKKRRSEQKK